MVILYSIPTNKFSVSGVNTNIKKSILDKYRILEYSIVYNPGFPSFQANAGPILIQLLNSEVDDIQSRASIILSDIACIEGNQVVISISIII